MSAAAELLGRLAPATAERVLREFLTELVTGKQSANAHPGVADLRELPVSERTIGAILDGMNRGAMTNPQLPAYSRELLANVLEPALTAVSREYPLPQHRLFTRILVATDFKPKSYIVGLDGISLDEIHEHGAYPTSTEMSFQGNPERIAPKTYGRVVSLTRQTLVNDAGCQYFGDLGRALTAGAYRKEAELVYGAMESNPNMADGQPWFDSTNTYTTSSGIVTAIEQGFALFASQTFPNGQYVGAYPSILVVPPSWTLYVDDISSDLLLQKPNVIKSPYVNNGYLIAGPSCPSIGLVGFDAALTPTIETNNRPVKDFDIGLQMKVRHEFAVLPLQRAGIVKLVKT